LIRWLTVRFARTALVGLLVGSVACGLVFSPGDYGDSPALEPEADTGVTTPDVAPPVDSASDASLPSTRIMLFAGRRDALPGEPSSVNVAETMRTTLSPSGELGPWTFDVPPSQMTTWTRGLLAGETLLLQSTSVFLATTFADDHISGAWRALPPPGVPESYLRAWLVSDAGLTAAGGQAGGVFTTNVYVASFDLADGGIEPWQKVPSKLVTPRGDVTLLRHVDHLYALGGRESTSSLVPGSDEVEVARFGADGSLGDFAATTKLVDPTADAASFGVLLPVVTAGAGHVFVLGGQTTSLTSSLSDVALAAKIDAASGNLGPWVALPKLPAPMSGAAALVVGDKVLVFGGSLGSSQSGDILALSIGANGVFDTAWKKIGTLPGPRSGLAAVVY